MITFDNTQTMGWEAAIRGMRNPMNSWEKSDSSFTDSWISVKDRLPKRPYYDWVIVKTEFNEGGNGVPHVAELINEKWHFQCLDSSDAEEELALKVTDWMPVEDRECIVGSNDLDLMTRLRNAGTDHRKFMRMLTVYVDITGPLYWWKEFDTYKVGTVANSCSTMHKIHDKEFTLDDFSHEHLESFDRLFNGYDVLNSIVNGLNCARESYLTTKDKKYWWQMIQLLPSSYNQKRTIMMNYEVLANIYKSRRNHKLDEWHTLCDWIESLPYSELITDNEIVNKLCDIGNINAISPNDIRIGLDLANNGDNFYIDHEKVNGGRCGE